MYKEFFGLQKMPFNITPDPNFLFLSPTHQDALTYLKYGIEHDKGFIVLSGEVGCGKTTLCRSLLASLEPETYQTVHIYNSQITEEQLLRDIIRGLSKASPPNDKSVLLEKLNDKLHELIAKDKKIIIIIDEAQNLSYNVLEQIRLLSNLESNERKLLQIILIGQPELKDKLKQNKLRQLRQRILVHFDLRPLTLKETRDYIQHRLTLSQGSGMPEFSYWAIKRIYNASKGIPRVINNICDKSLLSAFINASNTVKYKDVNKAIKEISFN